MAEKKPRVKNVKPSGQKFTDQDQKIFTACITVAQEVHARIEARSMFHPSHNRVHQIDFLLTAYKIATKHLSKVMYRKFCRLIDCDETLGVGTINRLTLLAPHFLEARMFPLQRWLVSEAAWQFQCKRQRDNLQLAMTGSQVATVAKRFSALPAQVAGVGVRHFFEDTAPTMVVSEPIDAPPEQIAAEQYAVDPFAAQEASV